MAGYDVNRGAKRARDTRAALGLDPAAPLECLLDVVEARYPVVIAALPDGVAGACWGGSLLWLNGNQLVRRQRFTLAHELGHACCGHDGALVPDTFETLSGRATNPYEVQANAFAAEFLVPAAGLRVRVEREPSLEEVAEIASEYGVSAPVVVYRLKLLKLASPERVARLEGEVAEGLHGHFTHSARRDRLDEIDALPYLSPALEGSLLQAALNGEAAVDRALAGAIDRLLT